MNYSLFSAKYICGKFYIEEFKILTRTRNEYEVENECGIHFTINNDIEKIAFCERSAILVLINSYNDMIDIEPWNITDILFQQRQVQNEYDKNTLNNLHF